MRVFEFFRKALSILEFYSVLFCKTELKYVHLIILTIYLKEFLCVKNQKNKLECLSKKCRKIRNNMRKLKKVIYIYSVGCVMYWKDDAI